MVPDPYSIPPSSSLGWQLQQSSQIGIPLRSSKLTIDRAYSDLDARSECYWPYGTMRRDGYIVCFRHIRNSTKLADAATMGNLSTCQMVRESFETKQPTSG